MWHLVNSHPLVPTLAITARIKLHMGTSKNPTFKQIKLPEIGMHLKKCSKMVYMRDFKAIFAPIFFKWAQLSPCFLRAFQKFVPANVVNQICQSDLKPCPCDPNGTNCDSVHRIGHEAKDVFDSTAHF